MSTDIFDNLLQEIPRLFQESASPLEDMGFNLFRSFATIHLAWFSAHVVLNKTIDAGRLLSLLAIIALVGTMITNYSVPIPGTSVSFRSLITDQAYEMAQLIKKDHIQRVEQRLAEVEVQIEEPGPFEVLDAIRYCLVQLLLGLAHAATLLIVSYGFLVSALAALTGPFFIPFLLVPGMDWLFWGWLKAYLQYSFYPVFAYGYTSLLGMMLVHFMDPATFQGKALATIFVPLVALLVVYIFGLLKLPAAVGSIFSGRSGEAAGPGL